jgi:hypothetical protein
MSRKILLQANLKEASLVRPYQSTKRHLSSFTGREAVCLHLGFTYQEVLQEDTMITYDPRVVSDHSDYIAWPIWQQWVYEGGMNCSHTRAQGSRLLHRDHPRDFHFAILIITARWRAVHQRSEIWGLFLVKA